MKLLDESEAGSIETVCIEGRGFAAGVQRHMKMDTDRMVTCAPLRRFRGTRLAG